MKNVITESFIVLNEAVEPTTIVFENDKVQIVTVNDLDAARKLSAGTYWSLDDKRMFDHYYGIGNIYVLLPKYPEYNGEKYGVSIAGREMINESNNTVTLDQLSERFGADAVAVLK